MWRAPVLTLPAPVQDIDTQKKAQSNLSHLPLSIYPLSFPLLSPQRQIWVVQVIAWVMAILGNEIFFSKTLCPWKLIRKNTGGMVESVKENSNGFYCLTLSTSLLFLCLSYTIHSTSRVHIDSGLKEMYLTKDLLDLLHATNKIDVQTSIWRKESIIRHWLNGKIYHYLPLISCCKSTVSTIPQLKGLIVLLFHVRIDWISWAFADTAGQSKQSDDIP